MIVSAMMRLLAGTGMCVERGVRRFASQRPPGIYKDHYICDLFRWVRSGLVISSGLVS